VELRGQGGSDRYGRTIAHVEVPGGGVAAGPEMVSRGHARVAAQVGNAACAADLLARERAARAAKLGLWDDPGYVVVAAGRGAELLAGRGQLTIAEGKGWSGRESGGTIYMNLCPGWWGGLTGAVTKV